MKEIFIAVATSLVASFIFWVIFNAIPENQRYNKIRPKVEFDIYEIFLNLGGYIFIALEINELGWSFPQSRVQSGQATKQDFELWLQNKCLNDSYKFDEMGKNFLSVGDRLATSASKICEKIERCATYYSFMSADEILLLRKISNRLTVYSYTESAVDRVGKSTYVPVVPNISYMAENFFELSQLYIKLQKIVWSYKKIDRSINKYIMQDFALSEAQKCYAARDFAGCIRKAKKIKNASEESKLRIMFKAYYAMGNLTKAIATLKQYYEIAAQPSVILYSVLEDDPVPLEVLSESVWDIIAQNHTDIEIAETINYCARAKAIEKKGLETVETIKAYYAEKLNENSKRASEEMKKKRQTLSEFIDKVREDPEAVE